MTLRSAKRELQISESVEMTGETILVTPPPKGFLYVVLSVSVLFCMFMFLFVHSGLFVFVFCKWFLFVCKFVCYMISS